MKQQVKDLPMSDSCDVLEYLAKSVLFWSTLIIFLLSGLNRVLMTWGTSSTHFLISILPLDLHPVEGTVPCLVADSLAEWHLISWRHFLLHCIEPVVRPSTVPIGSKHQILLSDFLLLYSEKRVQSCSSYSRISLQVSLQVPRDFEVAGFNCVSYTGKILICLTAPFAIWQRCPTHLQP